LWLRLRARTRTCRYALASCLGTASFWPPVMDASRDASASAKLSMRRGTDADIPDVLELWRDAETAPSTTDDPDALSVLLAADPDALLLAECEGFIVGTLIATFDGWRGNMYRLAILPEHRRHGVARSLVLEGERRLRSVGARRITALVAHELEGAKEFWNSLGYGADPRTTRFVKTLR
jgi:ribosomal protein S18 acetylase RimI-like enzyme